jgi:c-di-GMP-binding flagellar brake protein YcgR
MGFDQERRSYERLPRQFRVQLIPFAFTHNRQPTLATRCVNISAGGILLESDTFIEVGEKVQVRLFLPRLNKYHPSYFKVFESSVDQNLLAVAEVVRCETKAPASSYDIGIKFLDVYEDDWQALYRMLQSEAEVG